MTSSRDKYLSILRHNIGFGDPDRWVNYAEKHSFQRVEAMGIPLCPDCGSLPRWRVGQYVYYSTLIHLEECGACGLIWSDVHLDPRVILTHFEGAYKDRTYFRASRRRIFEDLVRRVDSVTPPHGTVLDIGGGQGDLMQMLRERRPDVKPTVADLSSEAVRFAREEFGLATICGDFEAVANRGCRFSVVVLSDVLYYEPRLSLFWKILPQLIEPGGTVVIRVPNKLFAIRIYQRVSEWARVGGDPETRDRVRYFNPEHIYILSRRYLVARLKSAEFGSVRVFPSPLLRAAAPRVPVPGGRLLLRLAQALAWISGGRALLTPSLVIIATDTGPTGALKSRDTTL